MTTTTQPTRRSPGTVGSPAAPDHAPSRTPQVTPSAAVPTSDRHRLRYDVEGLRALAVVLVALNHAELPHLGGGFVGVDVFFVLSGFLITGLLLGEVERRGRVSLAEFYARRVRRILPMGAVVTVVTMVAAYDLAGTAVGNRTADDAGWAAVFLGNVHFAASGVDYFSRGTLPSPLQHFWSLGVEEQFYVVWPLLVMALGALVARGPRRRRATLAVLGVVCALSLAWSVHQSSAAPTAAYFSPFTRAYELGLGAMLATAVRSRRRLLAYGAASAATVTGLGMVAASVVLFSGATTFPGYAALLPTLGTALVVLGGTDHPDGRASRLLGNAPMRYVGQRSYGFYLWHYPWLILPAAALGHRPALHLELLLVLGAFLTAALTYWMIEDPVRQSAALRAAPAGISLALGAALIAGVLAVSQFLQLTHRVDYQQQAGLAAADLPTQAQVVAQVADAVGLRRAPADLQPPADAVAEFGSLTPEESACDRDYDATTAADCFLGDLDATGPGETVAIWGDSHASMWTPALASLGEQTGTRVAVYAKYGCAPLLGVTAWHPTEDRPYAECDAFKTSVVPLLLALQPRTLVLTGAFRGWAWSEDGQRQAGGEFTSDNRWVPGERVDGVWDVALTRTLQALAPLAEAGTRIVVLGDTAYPTQDAGLCLSAHADDLAACTTSRADGVFADHDAAEAATAAAQGASYVDTTAWFCTDAVCPPVVADTAVHRDAYHLTRQYALHLTRVLGEGLGLLPATDDAG